MNPVRCTATRIILHNVLVALALPTIVSCASSESTSANETVSDPRPVEFFKDSERQLKIGRLLPSLCNGMAIGQVELMIGPPISPIDLRASTTCGYTEYYYRDPLFPGVIQVLAINYELNDDQFRVVFVEAPATRE